MTSKAILATPFPITINAANHLPLALYMHMPWCVKKCPYCDFNSYALPIKQTTTQPAQQATIMAQVNTASSAVDSALATAYFQCLQQDFLQQLPLVGLRKLSSVFVGGGTPSLLPAQGYHDFFTYAYRAYRS